MLVASVRAQQSGRPDCYRECGIVTIRAGLRRVINAWTRLGASSACLSASGAGSTAGSSGSVFDMLRDAGWSVRRLAYF